MTESKKKKHRSKKGTPIGPRRHDEPLSPPVDGRVPRTLLSFHGLDDHHGSIPSSSEFCNERDQFGEEEAWREESLKKKKKKKKKNSKRRDYEEQAFPSVDGRYPNPLEPLPTTIQQHKIGHDATVPHGHDSADDIFKQDNDKAEASMSRQQRIMLYRIVGVLLLSVVVAAAVVGIVVARQDAASGEEESSNAPTDLEIPPTPAPTTQFPTIFPTSPAPTTTSQGDLKDFIVSVLPSSEPALLDQSTPQFRALSWMTNSSLLINRQPTRILQLYALVTLYYSTGGDSGGWENSSAWLSDANDCDWHGVSCDDIFAEMLDLGFPGNRLDGALPPDVVLLFSLKTLLLSSNALTGTIPTRLDNFFHLERLSLFSNALTGTIPTQIGLATSLTVLSFSHNALVGTIPTEIGELTNLREIYLENNAFTGTIPTEFGLLTNLDAVFLRNNALVGTIPPTLCAIQDFFVDCGKVCGCGCSC